ncbi:MAG: serine protease [Phycisphaerales bacterium]|nr:serine protease [Phycisphaerales bacterium]
MILSLTACIALVTAPHARGSAPRADDVALFTAMDAARHRLHEDVSRSIVTVNAYIKVPEGVAYEGRWQVADESPFPGYAREHVSSGIFVNADGTVLCCRKPLTLEGGVFAERFEVESAQGERFEAELVASEPTINLGILRVKPESGTPGFGSLVPARIGKLDRLATGDTVFAIADPFGSARTFAPGVIMALPTAACYQADLTGSFIHGSMAVGPGSIGGALANPAGEVIGIIVPPPSLDPLARPVPLPDVTYAMQVDTALGVAEALKQKRSNDSPWLGFSVLSASELKARMRDDAAFAALAKPARGIYVDDLYDPSPASRAGVKRGDWVVEINGRPIAAVVDFQQALYYFSGTTVPVKLFRDGQDVMVTSMIERRPPEANR